MTQQLTLIFTYNISTHVVLTLYVPVLDYVFINADMLREWIEAGPEAGGYGGTVLTSPRAVDACVGM